MRNLQQLTDELQINNLSMGYIPNIDLYMDQVIQLFEDKLEGTKRNEQDKVLTKTMTTIIQKQNYYFQLII